MRGQTSLTRRGPVYTFRISVPVGLRQHFGGKREIRVSLRTKNKAEAVQLARDEHDRALGRIDLDAVEESLMEGRVTCRIASLTAENPFSEPPRAV